MKHNLSISVSKEPQRGGIVDYIRVREPALAEKLLNESIKISHEHMVEIPQLSSTDFARMTRYFLKGGERRPTYNKFRASLESYKQKDIVAATSATGTIKDMPVYDPDGEVCSLALTIPSWIGSINRTQSVTDFSVISESARAKLIYELDSLIYTVEGIRAALTKEANHGRSK